MMSWVKNLPDVAHARRHYVRLAWHFLAFPGISWHFLAFLGISRHFLAFLGISWHFLAFLGFLGNSWQFLSNVRTMKTAPFSGNVKRECFMKGPGPPFFMGKGGNYRLSPRFLEKQVSSCCGCCCSCSRPLPLRSVIFIHPLSNDGRRRCVLFHNQDNSYPKQWSSR